MNPRKTKKAAWMGVAAVAAVLVAAGAICLGSESPGFDDSSAGSKTLEAGERLGVALHDRMTVLSDLQAEGLTSEQSASSDETAPEEVEIVDSVGSPPVSIPQGSEVSWRESHVGRSWVFATPQTARVVGKSLIAQLAGGAWALEEAGFLGIDDSSWGCVARALDGSGAVVVHARPNVTGMAVGDDNPLIVSIAFLEPVL